MTLLRVSKFCRPSVSTEIPVKVDVTTKCPPRQKRKNPMCSSIAMANAGVLVALSRHDGSLACLVNGSKRVYLRLSLEDEGDDDGREIVAGEERENVENFKIWVPPIVAVNLGLSSSDDHNSCSVESIDDAPRNASHVILRPFARPADWPRCNEINPDEQQHFWIFPPANTLIAISHVLSVYDPANDRVCYYQVMAVRDDDGEDFKVLEFPLTTTQSTTFELDNSVIVSDFDIPRLPCLISQHHFCTTSTCSEISVPPHPNLSELCQALDLGASTPANECILHVIGTEDEHDICLAVETAAQHVGRTCWSLRGLAAFAHSVGKTVRSGSMVDQLEGLDAALEEIKRCRMEPCVLHLYDIDAELTNSDNSMRHDQEQRFLAKILEACARTKDDERGGALSSSYFEKSVSTSPCSLIVVLSTARPLKPGPWSESLVFPSIQLLPPDQSFTKFLCQSVPLHENSLALIYGRTAGEVKKIARETRGIEDGADIFVAVKQLCGMLDEKKRKSNSASVAQVGWQDIGGLDHVRAEIMDAIELPLKHPHLFANGKGRTGILLYGPPGTGKTLVAKAVATECGLPFLSVKGPELLGSYVGESEANVREVFQMAREAAEKNSPHTTCILFFDELDSLAPRRGGVGDGGGVMERVVATLLAELDGDSAASATAQIFVMAATNRPDLLDPSLLRPGRLDRSVYLGIATNAEERVRVLEAQLRKLKLAGDALLMSKEAEKNLPPCLSGADISSIVSGALLQAVDRLCQQADAEQNALREEGRTVEINDILLQWDEDMCTPTVLLEDILEAARTVKPSVSQDELEKYERLRDRYRSGPDPSEHDGDIFY